jgi:hypothetical protein
LPADSLREARSGGHRAHSVRPRRSERPQARGTTPDRSGPNYADYTALNATLETLIETAKHELNVRLLGDALPPVTHLEDTIAAWDVSAAREAAWIAAEQLWQYRGMPLLEDGVESMLDGFTAVIGKTLLVPVP